MAAPVLVGSSTGAVITAATGTHQKTGCTAGNIVILQFLVDGTGIPTVGNDGVNVENLAGTDGALQSAFAGSVVRNVGNPVAAGLAVYIGRALADTITSPLLSSAADMYVQWHEFSGVHTGTLLADVLENGTAGVATSAAGTSTSVADVGVTTLGADRLALNFVGINDDSTGIAAFVGMTGGTWAMPTSFESATGTDGTIALMTATIAAAGTIDGGADTITSDGWGVIGFALIPAAAAAYQPRHGFVNHVDPGVL